MENSINDKIAHIVKQILGAEVRVEGVPPLFAPSSKTAFSVHVPSTRTSFTLYLDGMDEENNVEEQIRKQIEK